jgi:hypothetical protein
MTAGPFAREGPAPAPSGPGYPSSAGEDDAFAPPAQVEEDSSAAFAAAIFFSTICTAMMDAS